MHCAGTWVTLEGERIKSRHSRYSGPETRSYLYTCALIPSPCFALSSCISIHSIVNQMRFTHEHNPYTAPAPPSLHQSTVNTPAKTAPATPTHTPFITPDTTPARAYDQYNNTPDRLSANPVCTPFIRNGPELTRLVQPGDFHHNTFFDPVWMSGPNVFSFAPNGTVVRPREYGPEPYPGYHADRIRRLQSESDPVNASLSQGFVSRDPKPWKNVAITEQDDAEFEAFQMKMRTGPSEWQPARPYVNGRTTMYNEPELGHTWPLKPHGQ